ncbi:UDP-N-acetylglucosamine 2-epimerase [Pseudomaricurvus sp. HS19]|uniref:UDP-N-acetylglucosamine 2-epimerase n=1 Tax=Pseudomaricurvus sp. HS19 TaxID=2692626 RepID=UPI00136836DD|nr:UDP-N-acetylglucosamine 2-epimerase [Pseudomaricurvus sp. HS19]MYM64714.1 hypothetical protein [Pseudomaricurvus sp. HS19]
MKELQDRGVDYNFVFSGQHRSTIQDIRKNFGIKEPDYILYSGNDITSIPKMALWSLRLLLQMLFFRRKIWKSDKTGIVLNHGDTLSTLLGSLGARMAGLKSAHVESGLRSFNFFNPFPEELTRVCVFSLSNVYFAPGQWALDNLNAHHGKKINTFENTLRDSLALADHHIESRKIDIPSSTYGIASIHRFENLSNEMNLNFIVEMIELAALNSKILFILHSPTEKTLKKKGLLDRIEKNPNIELRPRYDYFDFNRLLRESSFVLTDGGSNQEECYYLGKPCLIMRKATERQEGIGKNAVLSNYSKNICLEFLENITKYKIHPSTSRESATKIIIEQLTEYN